MPTLISDAYRAEQSALHAENADYGIASIRMAPIIARMIEKSMPSSILDYGAGKQRLGPALAQILPTVPPIRSYDPAFPELAHAPAPADLVVCVDVLEHIEPANLDAVLDHLAGLTGQVLFASITTGPSRRDLSDGRNAHLIQEPMEWWLPRIWGRFRIRAFNEMSDTVFWLTAVPKAP